MYLNYRELDADIIIIGAGIVGLSTAYHLLDKDPHIDFLILDVEEKIDVSIKRKYPKPWNMQWSKDLRDGKDIKTKFADDVSYEDFQFMSFKQTNLKNLLEILHVPVVKNEVENGKILVDYDAFYKVSDRKDILDFFSIREKRILNIFCKQIDNLCTSYSFGNRKIRLELDDISMGELLNRMIKSNKVRDVISQTFLYNSGLKPKDVSASFFLAYCNSTQGIQNQFIWNEDGVHQYFLEGGVEKMRYKMINLVGEESIIKVSEITQISWDDFCVEIKTSEEDFFANKIVFTLNETETNKINFVPPLIEEKTIIANNLVRGSLKKFIVIYEKPFWIERGLSGDVYVMNTEWRNGPVCVCLNVSKIGKNNYTLTGLADEDSDKMGVLNQLAVYFGEEAMHPEDYHEIPSTLHELSFFYGFKSMKNFEKIQKTWERIIWASPQTTTNWYGTAAGSIEAGFKGALRALREVKPNTLSMNDLLVVSADDVFIPPRVWGIFGIKWPWFIPGVLLIIYTVFRLKKFVSKKILK